MKTTIPDYSEEELTTHAVARDLIRRAETATREWINGECTRRYLTLLSGSVGVCIRTAKTTGLDGHHTGIDADRHEADALVAKLSEMREMLGYAAYASAELVSDPSLQDSPETRQSLVDQQVRAEPGVSFPEPGL